VEYTVSDKLKFLFSILCFFYCAEPLRNFSTVLDIVYLYQSYSWNGIETIQNQRNVTSIAGYVDPAIVDGWEFYNFEEEN